MADAGTPPAIAALEARLRADPDERESWRIYADYLLDRGDRRGELIHLHDAAAHEPKLKRRVESLEFELRAGPGLPDAFVGTWRHGFLVGLRFTLAVSRDVRELARILTHPAVPLLGALELGSDAELNAKFFAQLEGEPLARLTSIETRLHWSADKWDFDRGDALTGVLARAPELALRRLVLPKCKLGDKGLLALAKADALTDLRTLDLQGNPFGSTSLTALITSPVVATLEHLDLRNTTIDEQALDAIASSPHLGRLRNLKLPRVPGRERLLESTTLSAEVIDYWRGVLQRPHG